jgi:hypothetical protein
MSLSALTFAVLLLASLGQTVSRRQQKGGWGIQTAVPGGKESFFLSLTQKSPRSECHWVGGIHILSESATITRET